MLLFKILSSVTQLMLQFLGKFHSGASLCGTLQKIIFNDDCSIKHGQIIWLELILIQYFKKDKSAKG